jgi:beta-mannosidase
VSFNQFNDCWPCTSWAIVDYFLRPKPAYFTIARELRQFTVGITRKEKKTFANDTTAACFTIDTIIEIWATNSTQSDKGAILEVTSFDLHTDVTYAWTKSIALSQNSSTELYEGNLPGQLQRTKESDIPKDIIMFARLLDENNEVLARHSNWFSILFVLQWALSDV